MFYGTDGIIFIESSPTSTENTWLKYGAIIHKQQSGIGQFTVWRDQSEWFQIFVIPFLMSLLAEGIGKDEILNGNVTNGDSITISVRNKEVIILKK